MDTNTNVNNENEEVKAPESNENETPSTNPTEEHPETKNVEIMDEEVAPQDETSSTEATPTA